VQIHSLKSLSKFVAFYLYRQQVDRVKTRDCNKGRAAVLHAGTCSRPSRRDVQLPFTQWNWPSATDILWKQGMAWRIKFLSPCIWISYQISWNVKLCSQLPSKS